MHFLKEARMGENNMTNERTSRLAVASLVCMLAGAGILAISQPRTLVPGALDVASFPGAILLATSCLLGVTALIAISRDGATMAKIAPAVLAIIICSIIIRLAIAQGLGYHVQRPKTLPYQMLCGTNMKGIGNALLVYAQDNGEQLPEAARWCDELVTKADIAPASFVCKKSDTVKGESSYALNIAAVGKKLSDLPKDMVLVFEVRGDGDSARTFPVTSREYMRQLEPRQTSPAQPRMVSESRWNQVCGPELIDAATHSIGCNILFADMHVEFVKSDRLAQLRWATDGAVDFPELPLPAPEPAYKLPYAGLAVVALISLAGAGYSLRRYGVMRCRGLSVAMAVLAPIAGGYCGLLSQLIYELPPLARPPGLVAGIVVGILAALAYAPFLAVTSTGLVRHRDRLLYAVGTGMAAGIVSAWVVHIVLMLICRNMYAGLTLIVGIPYGLVAGTILGFIADGVLAAMPAAQPVRNNVEAHG
jgi:hypothetical protein